MKFFFPAFSKLFFVSSDKMTVPLLPSEVIIKRKRANLFISLSEYRLNPIAQWQSTSRYGMNDVEPIGGRLILTNFRLIFQAHSLNRIQGTFSIFLPTIKYIKNVSTSFWRKIQIETTSAKFVFVLWGIPSFTKLIDQKQSSLNFTKQNILKNDILQNLGVIIESNTMQLVVTNILQGTESGDNDVSKLGEFSASFQHNSLINVLDVFRLTRSVSSN